MQALQRYAIVSYLCLKDALLADGGYLGISQHGDCQRLLGCRTNSNEVAGIVKLEDSRP
jgi:hypothetical protein